MAKFVIPCPRCGSYTEARKGLFARRKVSCACGNVFNIKAEKIKSKVCPHCGNSVLYDQTVGESAKCPICHKEINTLAIKSHYVEISCPTCYCKLEVEKNAKTLECPLCDTVIDVPLRIKREEIAASGQVNVVKYEGGNDIFVWKHPIEDFSFGSQLIVHESQEAVFFSDGKALDVFPAGRHTLIKENLPKLEELHKYPNATFHSEVYFVNMATHMGIKWGTDSKVRLFDPASGLHVELGACGSFNLRVCDSRKLVMSLVGTTGELTDNDILGGSVSNGSMSGKFRSLIIAKVKSNLAKAIKENDVNVLEIDEYADLISEKLKAILNLTLMDYGLVMPEFYITNILTPDDDPNYRRLKEQFAARTLRVREEGIRKAEAEAAQSRKLLEAQTEAQLKVLGAQGDAEALRIRAMADADAYRAQAMAEADEMRAKGYTYAQETARQVGLTAMQNGITGNGVSGSIGGSLGEMAEIGVTLGAMGSVIGMTRDAVAPMMSDAANMGSAVGASASAPTEKGWSCACGKTGITSKFCPECGAKKPEPAPAAETWNCACGKTGITSKFCPECGAKKPAPAIWDCACGKTGITSKFCPECGAKKPE